MYWIKLLIILAIAGLFIIGGAVWFYRSFDASTSYDFEADLKRSFLTPHWSFSAHYNDGKPRRIVPGIVFFGGLGILAMGIVRVG